MAKTLQLPMEPAPKDRWLVVILCEDELMHARALSICDRLVQQFWGEIDFHFSWWLFTNLESATNAAEAARAAAEAEMIFFATQARTELPAAIKSWIELWANKRVDRGGALVCLTGDGGKQAVTTCPKELYFRQVAHRAAMDFLSDLPEHRAASIPESQDWFTQRASAMGLVMDGIIHQTGKPPPPMLS